MLVVEHCAEEEGGRCKPIAFASETAMSAEVVEPRLDHSTSDWTVDPVCEFYNAHPYPPPVENLDRARDEWRDENRQRAEYHLLWPHKPYRDDLEILVAGCGTWQAAKFALSSERAK